MCTGQYSAALSITGALWLQEAAGWRGHLARAPASCSPDSVSKALAKAAARAGPAPQHREPPTCTHVERPGAAPAITHLLTAMELHLN